MSVDLVMINAPYIDDYGPMKKAAGTYYPLGLAYISACVKAQGYSVTLCDPNVSGQRLGDLVAEVCSMNPRIIGISFMTPQFSLVKELSRAIKEKKQSTVIVVGGAHPSVMPEETLRRMPAVDYAVVGEGEQTVTELLHLVSGRGGARPNEILGIAYRDGEDIRLNASRPLIEDIDELPFPDRNLLDSSLYQSQSFLRYSKHAANIYTSRGCLGTCVFCCSGHALRSRIRQRSIGNVMEEIAAIRSARKTEYLLIKDDTFTLGKQRVQMFCRAIRKEHPDLKWHCMARVNTVDYDLLCEMKDAGLHDVFLGIESGNNEILKKSQKGITTEMANKVVAATDRLGILSYGAFILGLPGETPHTVQQTINFAKSLPLTMAGFSILTPYPGTKVYDDFFVKNDSDTDYSQFIASTGIHYVTGYTGLSGGLTMADLPALVSKAQREFYVRPAQIFRMLRYSNLNMWMGYASGAFALVRRLLYLRTGANKAPRPN